MLNDQSKNPSLVGTLGISRYDNPAALIWESFSVDYTLLNNNDLTWQRSQLSLILPILPIRTALSVHFDMLSGLNNTSIDSNGVFQSTSTFTHSKLGGMLTVGDNLLFPELFYGINAKFYQQKILDESCAGTGYDLGFIYKLPFGLYSGFALNDIGNTKITWSTGQEDIIPANYDINLAFSSNNLNFGLNYNSLTDKTIIKTDCKLYHFLEASAAVPLNNIMESAVSVYLNLSPLKIGLQADYNEIRGLNSAVNISFSLDGIL